MEGSLLRNLMPVDGENSSGIESRQEGDYLLLLEDKRF